MEKAHVDLTITHTERANHAFEIVNKEIVPGQYDSVVTVSGDGLIHEVVNGLMTRDDWNVFKSTITIGCLPGGTSNGLVKALLDHIGEEYSVLNAAWRIAKGKRKYMDVTEYSLEY